MIVQMMLCANPLTRFAKSKYSWLKSRKLYLILILFYFPYYFQLFDTFHFHLFSVLFKKIFIYNKLCILVILLTFYPSNQIQKIVFKTGLSRIQNICF